MSFRTSLNRLSRRFSPIKFCRFSTGTYTMAELNINTKYKMLSGYEIPALGYGVCCVLFFYPLSSIWRETAVVAVACMQISFKKMYFDDDFVGRDYEKRIG